MNQDYITIYVTSNDLGQRIDLFLSEKIKEISRNRIINLIKEQNIFFNNKTVLTQSFILKNEGKIIVNLPKPKESKIIPKKMNLDIIYEDNNLIVLNKESGLVVHPGAGNIENTLVNGLLYHCKGDLSGIGGVLRPGIVHRIDKMTSGILVVAKDDYCHKILSKQFKDRKIKRHYICITLKSLPKSKGIIEENIKRSKIDRKKMTVCKSNEGKKAITEYFLEKNYLLDKNVKINIYKCKLQTGRTHQIRVHFSFMNSPILGDHTYGKNMKFKNIPENISKIINEKFLKTKRQALHAESIGFFHPIKKKDMFFKSELPDEFKILIKSLENASELRN